MASTGTEDTRASYYSMGPQTLKVPADLFVLNRKRLCDRLRKHAAVENNAIVLLQGGSCLNLYDTDVEYVFRQEPYFFWAFGVHEEDCYGAIHVPSGKAYLFVPKVPADYLVWIGSFPSLEGFKQKYLVDEVYYTNQISDVLKSLSPDTILTLNGVNSDSRLKAKEASFLGIQEFEVNNSTLFDHIAEWLVPIGELDGSRTIPRPQWGRISDGSRTVRIMKIPIHQTVCGWSADHLVCSGYSPLRGSIFAPILMIEGTTLRPAGNTSGSTFVQRLLAGLYKRPTGRTIRVVKSEFEKEVMRYAARISSNAHKAVMNMAKPGLYEYQCEAMFLHYVYHTGGCRHVAYTCICASGGNGATLHYGSHTNPNRKLMADGDLCVFDMGAEYCGYSSDITVTFPVNGRFTEDQKFIYNAVLAANLAVQKAAKPGVLWSDMHLLANRVMLEELKKIDLVRGDVDEMMEAGIAAIFQPHGLGHLLGLDVHDVGGYIAGCPERSSKPGLRALRTARPLEAGMAVTIEPGCYFVNPLINEALQDPVRSKYLNEEVLKRFQNFGGVRIEDDVFITEDGIENYTKVPRTIEEIENWMNSEKILNGKITKQYVD